METQVTQSFIGKAVGIFHQSRKKFLKDIQSGGELPPQTVFEAGFEIPKSNKKEVDEVYQELSKQIDEEIEFREELIAKGFNPIAVLPHKVFEEMITDLDFYTFYNFNEKGEVPSDLRNLSNLKSFAPYLKTENKRDTVRYFGILAFCFGLSILFLKLFVPGLLIMLFTIGAIIFSEINTIKALEKDVLREDLLVKKLLWPDNSDKRYNNCWVKITLPDPPPSFIETLKRCRKEKITTYLVVHRRAFSVDIEDVIQRYKDAFDPIICTKEGETVAILDQFGDFPEETQLLETIKKRFNPNFFVS